MTGLAYLKGYSETVLQQVQRLLDNNQLDAYLKNKYSTAHNILTDALLYDYSMALKNSYMKKAPPLRRICFDPKISAEHHALGINAHIARAHGGKLKASHEIRIDPVFKHCPEPFLRMIVVHELAHLKEREHNKAFYQLCTHIEPDYFQLELDLRLLLLWQSRFSKRLY